jgi:hypothetical protein
LFSLSVTHNDRACPAKSKKPQSFSEAKLCACIYPLLPAPQTPFLKRLGRAAKTASRWRSRKAGKRALRCIFSWGRFANRPYSPSKILDPALFPVSFDNMG